MKVLFIGGTGVISSACSELAIVRGLDLYHLNRGNSGPDLIPGVKTIVADIRNMQASIKALENHDFDAVVDWISYTPDHIKNSIEFFSGRTKQFVFISSASAYQTPPEAHPITELTPLSNPFWQYSRDKIACEEILVETGLKQNFPYTIVRPSHTYNETKIPLVGGYSAMHRMKHGKPVVVHGDGTSIWTLTHSSDFAVGLVGLLGKTEAIGEAYQITSDEWLSWNNIYHLFAKELGVKPNLVHIPSHLIARYDKEIGDGLLGDKMHSMIFDNAKIKALVPEFGAKIPFREGVKEIVEWHDKNPLKGEFDTRIDQMMDELIRDYAQL